MASDEYDIHLRVYLDRSELHARDGSVVKYLEGQASEGAQARYGTITTKLNDGFLTKTIEEIARDGVELSEDELSERHREPLRRILDTVTSEVGRALSGLTVLQLTIKAICPEQSIRLHKGGGLGFGWEEGVSMRTLDRAYITPELRKYQLLKMNRDGVMMTRSLAENYPYSSVYKAAIRGAAAEWRQVVELLESGDLPPLPSLKFFLSGLHNRAEALTVLGDAVLEQVEGLDSITLDDAYKLVWCHVTGSDYAARLMEVAMHSLLLALEADGLLGEGEVVPLSQMRSANKKHGNIGDVEIKSHGLIVESWDAKFGKNYLRDELEELYDKLPKHPQLKQAGFVLSEPLDRPDEQLKRAAEIHAITGVDVPMLTMDEWVRQQVERSRTTDQVGKNWLRSYTLALAQRNPEKAPMDEPTFHWLQELSAVLETPPVSWTP